MNDKKEKIAVIGAGISGLAIARILSGHSDVTVYEKASRPGGLVKCDVIDSQLFHRTGGHVFNTKRQDVLDWFWRQFDRDREFTKAERHSVIILPDGRYVQYPIENHAYQLPEPVQRSFIGDLIAMAKTQHSKPENFGEFLQQTFGDTLYGLYFRPYNEKVWRTSLHDVPLSWLAGKLPMPTLEEMLYANFNHVEERQFVHSTFYYPVSGGSQFVADRLAQGLNIKYDTEIRDMRYADGGWTVDGDHYDKVIYCGNIKQLPSVLSGVDISAYSSQIAALKAHGTTTVLCQIDENPYSWIYLPDPSYEAHRIICTGNFSPANRTADTMSATVEFTDYIDQASILDNLCRIPLHPRYIAHNYAEYTYPIQAPGTRTLIADVKRVTEPCGLYLLGRFAEWEYYNMDVAIGAALDLSTRLGEISD